MFHAVGSSRHRNRLWWILVTVGVLGLLRRSFPHSPLRAAVSPGFSSPAPQISHLGVLRSFLGMGARAELSAAPEGFDRSPSQMKVALACRNKDSLTGARLCWAAPIRSGARKNLGNGSPPVQSRIKPHHGRGEELALRNTAAKNSRRTGPGVCTLLHPRPGPSSAGLVHCGKWRL